VDFFLQVDSHGSINADDFVGADAGACGDVAVGVVDVSVVGKVADDVIGALDGGSDEMNGELLPVDWRMAAGLGSADCHQE
jgi:hypothetical protein